MEWTVSAPRIRVSARDLAILGKGGAPLCLLTHCTTELAGCLRRQAAWTDQLGWQPNQTEFLVPFPPPRLVSARLSTPNLPPQLSFTPEILLCTPSAAVLITEKSGPVLSRTGLGGWGGRGRAADRELTTCNQAIKALRNPRPACVPAPSEFPGSDYTAPYLPAIVSPPWSLPRAQCQPLHRVAVE